MLEQLYHEAEQLQDKVIAYRRDLHQIPEVGMDLPNTLAYVKKCLGTLGIDYQEVGRCGLSALIGRGERTILLRADMDALPVEEKNDLPFRSCNGNMHACGHDMHTAILLGAAELLKRHEPELACTVKLMFQPGEEYGMGAKDMIDAGVLEDPKVDIAAALHMDALLPCGRASYNLGVAASSINSFFIDIQGKGGHSSKPEECVNPLSAAAYITAALHSLVQQEVGISAKAVLAVCTIEGGTQANIIPDTAKLSGTLRCFDAAVQERLLVRIREIVEGTAKLHGATAAVKFLGTPCLVVDEGAAKKMVPALESVYGKDHVSLSTQPLAGSEDFSYVSAAVPTFFTWVGAGNSDNAPLHNPGVIFDERSLTNGVKAMVSFAFFYSENTSDEEER